MTVQMFSRYARLGASSRLRMFQYEPYLRANGMDVAHRPFFEDAYLECLYSGQRTLGSANTAYLSRFGQLRQVQHTDVIWLEKEALPWIPAGIERVLMPSDVPVVTDYDDAVFHRYDLHRLKIVRRGLGQKIDRVMGHSSLVMAGNAYLAERAQAAGASQIKIVPTVVDTENYSQKHDHGVADAPRIGWIGTPSTWREYMVPMMEMLAEVAETEGARVSVVGAGLSAIPHPILDNLPWAEATEAAQIQAMDIGIMPLTDTPWARGKCGYKLIQYMACGLPVVASPVGVNAEIVEHGVNGFLVTNEAEWREALTALLRDPELRQKMGEKGRRKIEQHYSLQTWGPKVARMLKDIAGQT